MRMVRFIGFFAMGLFLIIGCGKNTDTNTTVQEGAAGGAGIIVHVSDGNPSSQPIYSWTNPDTSTNAEKITVSRTSCTDPLVWGIEATPPGQDGILSPWQQGTYSASVTALSKNEQSLTSSIEYCVTVTKADGSTVSYSNVFNDNLAQTGTSTYQAVVTQTSTVTQSALVAASSITSVACQNCIPQNVTEHVSLLQLLLGF